ncbi:MAG: hypothetical protein NT075_20195 [Chloroflexi bacterium]|nr:hypothetical protein [Chloroflexota bacterium]
MHPLFWFILLPIGIITLWVCSLALAQADVKPPGLVALHLELTPLTLSPGKRQLLVTARFIDDISGLYYAAIRFVPAIGAVQNYQVEFSQNNRISGTATDGIYASGIELLPASAAGPWVMIDIVMIDQAGNRIQLDGRAPNSWAPYQTCYFANGEENPGATTPTTIVTTIATTGFDQQTIVPVI